MKNVKTIICIISAFILIGTIAFNMDEIKEAFIKIGETDSERFKREYEEYNGVEVYGTKYAELKIEKDNPIKYTNVDEIKKLMKDGTGIIYLGYANCPWCRSMVPALLQAAYDNMIETIYYIDLKDARDKYVVKDGKLDLEQEGSKDYKEYLKIFDEFLEPYIVEDEEGNEYYTDEKRIYVPLVLFVREGKVIGIHLDTVESQENPFLGLNEEQYEELYHIYSDYMQDMMGSICDERC